MPAKALKSIKVRDAAYSPETLTKALKRTAANIHLRRPAAQKIRATMTPTQIQHFTTTTSMHPHNNLGKFLHPKKSR